jgi:hypothetical protein
VLLLKFALLFTNQISMLKQGDVSGGLQSQHNIVPPNSGQQTISK